MCSSFFFVWLYVFAQNQVLKIPNELVPKVLVKSEKVYHQSFMINYSEKHETALLAVYFANPTLFKGDMSREGIRFEPDYSVSTSSATWADYAGSGYDRGHLVPFADFKCCREMAVETFLMSNIIPQLPDFNREIWSALETRTRFWARRHKGIWVFTGPVYGTKFDRLNRRNSVAIPTAFYKIVAHVNAQNQLRTLAFLLPHRGIYGQTLSEFVVSIDQIEAQTKIDFFSQMSATDQTSFENTKGEWTFWNEGRF